MACSSPTVCTVAMWARARSMPSGKPCFHVRFPMHITHTRWWRDAQHSTPIQWTWKWQQVLLYTNFYRWHRLHWDVWRQICLRSPACLRSISCRSSVMLQRCWTTFRTNYIRFKWMPLLCRCYCERRPFKCFWLVLRPLHSVSFSLPFTLSPSLSLRFSLFPSLCLYFPLFPSLSPPPSLFLPFSLLLFRSFMYLHAHHIHFVKVRWIKNIAALDATHTHSKSECATGRSLSFRDYYSRYILRMKHQTSFHESNKSKTLIQLDVTVGWTQLHLDLFAFFFFIFLIHVNRPSDRLTASCAHIRVDCSASCVCTIFLFRSIESPGLHSKSKQRAILARRMLIVIAAN